MRFLPVLVSPVAPWLAARSWNVLPQVISSMTASSKVIPLTTTSLRSSMASTFSMRAIAVIFMGLPPHGYVVCCLTGFECAFIHAARLNLAQPHDRDLPEVRLQYRMSRRSVPHEHPTCHRVWLGDLEGWRGACAMTVQYPNVFPVRSLIVVFMWMLWVVKKTTRFRREGGSW